jgi:pyruvate/2-oxoglutarate dehydrogenase complex dihydrolipoamide acyltransferase (E2) component
VKKSTRTKLQKMDSTKIARVIQLAKTFDPSGNDSDLYKLLAGEGLLPKKMIPKEAIEGASNFASPKAAAFAKEFSINVEGQEGTGRGGSFTIADLKKIQKSAFAKPAILASPQAILLANEHKIKIEEIQGTGKDGRIKIEDVKAAIEKDAPAKLPKLLITPQAQVLATERRLTEEQLRSISGSGADGKILKADIEEISANSDSEEED